eukprot:scaffold83_cov286-Prasinococcus_capsulatus_cf.AAC.7
MARCDRAGRRWRRRRRSWSSARRAARLARRTAPSCGRTPGRCPASDPFDLVRATLAARPPLLSVCWLVGWLVGRSVGRSLASLLLAGVAVRSCVVQPPALSWRCLPPPSLARWLAQRSPGRTAGLHVDLLGTPVASVAADIRALICRLAVSAAQPPSSEELLKNPHAAYFLGAHAIRCKRELLLLADKPCGWRRRSCRARAGGAGYRYYAYKDGFLVDERQRNKRKASDGLSQPSAASSIANRGHGLDRPVAAAAAKGPAQTQRLQSKAAKTKPSLKAKRGQAEAKGKAGVAGGAPARDAANKSKRKLGDGDPVTPSPARKKLTKIANTACAQSRPVEDAAQPLDASTCSPKAAAAAARKVRPFASCLCVGLGVTSMPIAVQPGGGWLLLT